MSRVCFLNFSALFCSFLCIIPFFSLIKNDERQMTPVPAEFTELVIDYRIYEYEKVC